MPGQPERGVADVLDTVPSREAGTPIGRSREGRPVLAHRIGTGARRISLIGGCHADEPVGPRFLRHLAAWLVTLPDDDPLIHGTQYWIVPHANPDGEARNRRWYDDDDEAYDVGRYLTGVIRELPGDDMEFGFPRDPSDDGARPENRALYDWWHSTEGPFSLHASLHGMGFAAGPWYLIEPAWIDRTDGLRERCARRTADMGYTLHDVERDGEKGFHRIDRGFTTRPDSRAMRAHFQALGDDEMAGRFRPSSMEAIRSIGGDPLTLVSEMPLFITPGVGVELGPPDPVAVVWKGRIDGWRAELARGSSSAESIRAEAESAGLSAMPIRDQMALQWNFVLAGLEAIGR